MGLVATVRNKLDKSCLLSGRLNKNGCKVSMLGAPKSRLILDFDKPGSPLKPDQTRCDYLFIAEDDQGTCWVSPLELKRGHLHAAQAVKQLQAGADTAAKYVPSRKHCRFHPIAVYTGISKFERNELKSNTSKVRFRGLAVVIQLIKCGARLADALNP